MNIKKIFGLDTTASQLSRVRRSKKFSINKFSFIDDNKDRNKKGAKEGDIYFRFEYRFARKWPFIKEIVITYKLINDEWVEQI